MVWRLGLCSRRRALTILSELLVPHSADGGRGAESLMGALAKPAKGTAKAERAARRRALRKREHAAMMVVRRRDRVCRFPFCRCREFSLRTEVSHTRHRGMGGNPAGDRTVPELMVLLCRWRHQDGRIAVDRGGIRWAALTADGANGPIRWYIDTEALRDELRPVPDQRGWLELARESRPGHWEPLTPWQGRVLRELGKMEL